MKLSSLGLVILALSALASIGAAQCEQQKIEGTGLQDGDNFGNAVAVSGNWAIVGASHADDILVESGAAYVFERTASGWVERQRLKASDPATNAGFGHSLQIEGTTIAVGAPGAYHQGIQYVGAVYIFELSGGTWTQTWKLTPGDAAMNYACGYSVALSGSRLIAGAIGEWHMGLHTGAAYIFEKIAGTWTQLAKVIASDGDIGHNFGYSVALQGDLAVVGAVGVPQGTIGNVGAAYVFEKQGTQWPETQKLHPPNPSPTQYYAFSIGLTSDSILVGASNNHLGATAGGAVFIYQHPAAYWVQTQILMPADLATSDYFGTSLSVSGEHVVIGSYSADLAPAEGASYIFREVGSTWIQAGKCLASDLVYGDAMGHAAIDGSTVLIPNPRYDGACPGVVTCNSGSAYFFEFAPDTVQYGSCAGGGICGNSDGHGGCVNSTGQGAVLGAYGTSSVAADDLVLEGRWLPPGVNAICFMGRDSTNVLLGDGLRVAESGHGSSLYRFPAMSASPTGVLALGPGIVSASGAFAPLGQIQPGQNWNFQVWYRDVGGPCGSGTNTSNGLTVVFAP